MLQAHGKKNGDATTGQGARLHNHARESSMNVDQASANIMTHVIPRGRNVDRHQERYI